ncbi:YbaK/EbsC family protein [Streptoalloteichus hindustanus]|uniref:Cys-tRNA(Pro) deacylase, prolyl-tRNA editing enzyme YbaK/EbsC n=1 Tax=Streptoalloteichus hindustanus TaxID=2017 RepID=A0A1M4U0E1_STRHI|nr:YbaK/EbsC family protein [Streptoalloteichus hindustanus]SHE50188.1 Cys-tRNA(Pro) deacylase, prolyl-tRNA editing enzyme YbaK/EbsC [Streptoalloteichus hindustanus]
MTSTWTENAAAGRLSVVPATDRLDLLAEPVAEALRALPADAAARCGVAEIDPTLADTAELCARFDVPLSASANCVVVSGKRAGETRYAACLVLATTRVDVNGAVKRWLDVRKASFAPMADAVGLTGMEYGGITPLGLPADWPLLVDPAVAATPLTVVGSGTRRGKLLVPGEILAALPGAEVLPGLGVPVS